MVEAEKGHLAFKNPTFRILFSLLSHTHMILPFFYQLRVMLIPTIFVTEDL